MSINLATLDMVFEGVPFAQFGPNPLTTLDMAFDGSPFIVGGTSGALPTPTPITGDVYSTPGQTREFGFFLSM